MTKCTFQKPLFFRMKVTNLKREIVKKIIRQITLKRISCGEYANSFFKLELLRYVGKYGQVITTDSNFEVLISFLAFCHA